MSQPEKKKRKLNSALAEAIGATTKTSTENLEKPVALALISDEKSAKTLLDKINAHHRPKEILDLTLKVCTEKGDEAVVSEPFLALFRQYFSILGLDSAQNCWKQLESALNSSKSSNEVCITVEFIKKANLLGQGFGKLIDSIKTSLPTIIKRMFAENLPENATALSYSLICLILAQSSYLDQPSPNFWDEKVLTKEMKTNISMAYLTILAYSQNEEPPWEDKSSKWARKLIQKCSFEEESEKDREMIVNVFINHIEYFATVLPKTVLISLISLSIQSYSKKKQLSSLVNRLKTSEIEDLPIEEVDAAISTELLEKLNIENGASKKVEKYFNFTGDEACEKIEQAESCSEAVKVLNGVHTSEAKKMVLEPIFTFVENIEGAKSLDEIELYSKLIDMYGGTPSESVCIQIILARMATDNWAVITKLVGEEVETSTEEDIWFEILVNVISLLDKMIKNAKNSIIKSFSAVYCQLYTQSLKNVQKFIRFSDNSQFSTTLSQEQQNVRILRKHKLIQDMARIAESMKRHESYFSMLAASIIGNTVFNGSSTILVMARLHSIADKNASALLAVNLPVIERTRYNKFLPIITRASKKIY